MPAHPLPDYLAQQALDKVAEHGSERRAATALGIPHATLSSRIQQARARRMSPSNGLLAKDSPEALKHQIRLLKDQVAKAEAEALDASAIRRRIVGLRDATESVEPPAWLFKVPADDAKPGVPTLFLSDLHWGEVVKSAQIMNKNSYSLEISHERMRHLIATAIHLLRIISPKMEYPGIVMPLGGDMISGNIHEELAATNQINTMPTVLDLYGVLVGVIRHLAETFGNVFLPCVTGNHGRDTLKIWNKDRHHTSFDWLLYCFLAKHFEDDKRVKFLIPDGPDAYYRVFEHRYLLTHGDQFRGGDGMIGALGPIIRGDHKKRARNAQIDMEYDTMLCGHWHQYIHLTRLIVNGSLKGYDEYAFNNNFPFERPQQALWLNHPSRGITYRMPVYVDRKVEVRKAAWVSVAA